jgi:hypothetical protein
MRGDGEVITSGCKWHNLGGRTDLIASGKISSTEARSLGANPSAPLGIPSAAAKTTQASPARWCSSPSTAAAASRSSRGKGA